MQKKKARAKRKKEHLKLMRQHRRTKLTRFAKEVVREAILRQSNQTAKEKDVL